MIRREGLIGRSLRRQEDPRLLRGKGQYIADVAPPGLLHLAVVRSPHAHARILGIDTRAAAGVPGVVTVLTAADLDGIGALPVLAHPPGQRQSDFPVLPADRALYAGQPVAAVVAESRYVAEDALDAVRVEWDPLPALTDVVQATAPGAPRLYEAWPDNVAVGREIGSGDPGRFVREPRTRSSRPPSARRGRRRPRSRGAGSAPRGTPRPARSPCGRPARRPTSSVRCWRASSVSTRSASA